MKYRKTMIGVGVFAAVIAGIVAILAVVGLNWLRGPIERHVYDKTGRHLQIEGDVSVKWGWPPLIHIGRMRYENPEWSQEAQMGTVEVLEFAPHLRSLFGGHIVLERLRVVGPDVVLERTRDGKRNWVFAKSDDYRAYTPEIRMLTLENGVVRVRDELENIEARAEVSTTDTSASPATNPAENPLPTAITFTGKYQDLPFSGQAHTGSVMALQHSNVAFPLRVQGKIGETAFDADGSFTDLLQLKGVDARVKISGPDASKLYPLLPVVLPHSPPFSIEGRLRNQHDAQYSYEEFKGLLGGSDIAGSAIFTHKKPRSHLAANFHSRILDLKDLGPMIGLQTSGAADAGRGAIASQTEKRVLPPDARVLPDKPFRLERLRAMDADVTIKAEQVRRPAALALEHLEAKLKLDDAVLTLEPLNFGFAGGNILSNIQMNARQDPIHTQATISLRSVKLKQLLPTVKLMQESEGALGAQMKISGHGNSLARTLATADGEAHFATSGGAMSNILIEFMGLDAGEIIKFKLTGDRQTAIRCGVASFVLKDGEATAQTLVFDTNDTRIDGSGQIDLRDEQWNLLLEPHPKDRSILVLRSPLHIVGTFAHPAVKVDKEGLLKRAGGALVLALANPLAALLPLIETGTGTDANCKQLLASAQPAQREERKPPVKPSGNAGSAP
ncbi:MAG: AsmA family protein [Burkholderiaceae bacterium]|nr:MAG: AsmA family protein [Burkholderiaceae bacterium]